MKKKSLFKSKTQMIIYCLIFVICIVLFIVIGKTDFQKNIDSDAKKFNSLYEEVDVNNLYNFVNASDVLNILNGRSGIILFGFPSNDWTHYVAKILDDVSKELKIEKLYYYDFLHDRDESNGTYETIVNKLENYVVVDDEGIKDLHAPTVLVVKNGNVIAYFDETSYTKGLINPEQYYTANQIDATSQNFKIALFEYIK